MLHRKMVCDRNCTPLGHMFELFIMLVDWAAQNQLTGHRIDLAKPLSLTNMHERRRV